MPSLVTLTGPGKAVITDDAGAAIVAQTAALEIELRFIDSNLFEINKNLARIADNSATISKTLRDLDVSLGSVAVAQVQNNSIQAAMAVNQIQTNNFQTAVTKQALVDTGQKIPELPSIEAQLKTSIKDALVFNQVTQIEGLINNQINSIIRDTALWVTGTEAYKGISGWVKNQISIITTPLVAKSQETIKSITQALSGIKAP